MTNVGLTSTECVQLFQRALTGSNYAPNTIAAYVEDVRQFLAFVSTIRIDWDDSRQFTRADVVEFLEWLAGQHATGVTRVRKLAAIRRFLGLLRDNRIIPANPAQTVKAPIREQRDPAVLYKNEYKALLYEASAEPRDHAIIQLFLQTGVRVGELVGLTRADLDFENRVLTVRQGKGRRDRTIPLEEQSLKALKVYLHDRDIEREAPLFLAKNGTSLDVRTVRYLVHKYLLRAGVRKKASVHTLRHTFGTHKVDRGMTLPALQELLGHKKMETTYKYVHLAKTSLRQQQEMTAL